MRIRPIEPGCLAVIVGGYEENIGNVVTPVSFDPHDGLWSVVSDSADLRSSCRGFVSSGWLPAAHLLRIDDHGEDGDDYAVIREEWGLTA